MTQPTLFDQRRRPPTLPHQGRTVEAAEASQAAAEHAATRRAPLQARYLALLLRVGAHGLTDHEASVALRVPVSSMCSTRAALRAQLCPHGHRTGPYGERNTVYVLRLVAGRRFDTDEEVA